MTKIDGRSKKEATRQLDESLRRLGVDYIDLVQHHEIIRFAHTVSFILRERTQLWLKRAPPVKFATSDLPATKTRTSIYTCSP